jgi:hypothetical protein
MIYYTFLIKSDENIHPVPRSHDRVIGKPYLKEIMAASHTGLIILMRKYMIAGPRKHQAEGIADSLYPLPCLAAYFYRIIHVPVNPF